MNSGVCDQCRKIVPVEHVIRDGKVYLRKDCPDCGPGEALVSSDAERWQWKRDLYRYDPDAATKCKLRCEECGFHKRPRLVFVDVTNRCNLNCPICLANVPGMGFEFNPPLRYFERIFEELGRWGSKPRIELFGGEPTVRDDLLDIIRMARQNGLPVSVVTNSIRLADEQYCKEMCDAKVDLILAFDGRDPEIYERMRGSRAAYYKKLQALENVSKYSKRKHTVVCTLARNINDRHMKDYFEFVHKYRPIIRRLFFIPLTEMWESGEYETDVATTLEDVEHILEDAFGDEKLEFLPAGLLSHIQPAHRFFSNSRVRFAGVHPNCESATYLVSDGERYRPFSQFLKRPLAEAASEFITRAGNVNPRLQQLDPKRAIQRWRGRVIAMRAFGGLALRTLDFKKIMKGNRFLTTLRLIVGLLLGRDSTDLLRKHTYTQDGVALTILPFEEPHSIESARLERCTAAFAYLDPDTDQLETVPFCMWCLYRKDIFRKIAQKYEADAAASPEGEVVRAHE